MITIEEYIARRKKEDKVNEFDIDLRIENVKLWIPTCKCQYKNVY